MSRAAVRHWARGSTLASAALEGRVVPPGFVRSAAAQAYLDARRLRAMWRDINRAGPPPPTRCWLFVLWQAPAAEPLQRLVTLGWWDGAWWYSEGFNAMGSDWVPLAWTEVVYPTAPSVG